jgi:hypothetical protein
MSIDLTQLNDLQVPKDFEISIRLQEHVIVIQAIKWDINEITHRISRGHTRSMLDRPYFTLKVQDEIDKLVREIEAQGEPAESPLNQNPETLVDSNQPQEEV